MRIVSGFKSLGWEMLLEVSTLQQVSPAGISKIGVGSGLQSVSAYGETAMLKGFSVFP